MNARASETPAALSLTVYWSRPASAGFKGAAGEQSARVAFKGFLCGGLSVRRTTTTMALFIADWCGTESV
jgi:hypothetical protein